MSLFVCPSLSHTLTHSQNTQANNINKHFKKSTVKIHPNAAPQSQHKTSQSGANSRRSYCLYSKLETGWPEISFPAGNRANTWLQWHGTRQHWFARQVPHFFHLQTQICIAGKNGDTGDLGTAPFPPSRKIISWPCYWVIERKEGCDKNASAEKFICIFKRNSLEPTVLASTATSTHTHARTHTHTHTHLSLT